MAPFAYVAACLCLCCCPFRACALSASDTHGATLGYKLLALQAVGCSWPLGGRDYIIRGERPLGGGNYIIRGERPLGGRNYIK